ncbi:hypothetical protein TL5118_01781 [Thalassovita autumnalis]|uniref:Uncharacterized protein n=1 Tax=Thalassovita autumnalis TaxID=2072972 RepID=A0A0P1FRZ4_9RHOB|nr:hypothetical protein [Thalassovita autumnalis]CUH66488.1 hypothetical protein TL5118_01781 [Thalassovita autumnalis]CUH71228.1 hypothetical protein TL5120_01014 [Thalassovita autumnalis]
MTKGGSFNPSKHPAQLRFAAVLLLCLSFFILSSVTPVSAAPTVLHIHNDPGGSLPARLQDLQRLRQSGQRVEIRRGYCNSACTLYLGLPDTCISVHARFGFHGPQLATRGLKMLPTDFERWSQTMADHYPPALRRWFLSTARHSTTLITLSGEQLINMGVTRCT